MFSEETKSQLLGLLEFEVGCFTGKFIHWLAAAKGLSRLNLALNSSWIDRLSVWWKALHHRLQIASGPCLLVLGAEPLKVWLT